MLFIKRKRLTEEAEEWCKNHHCDMNNFNIVTALDALGKLDMAERVDLIQAEVNKMWKAFKSAVVWALISGVMIGYIAKGFIGP